MALKKIVIVTFFPLLLGSFLFSQSLVEVAQKEKERRESLKGKRAMVVTNADLAKLKKGPSLSLVAAQPELAPVETSPEPETEAREEEKLTYAEPSQEVAPQVEKAPETEALAKKGGEEQRVALEEKWNKAKEYVDLLETKMNGLWQKFYSFDDMISRDSIQQEISDTYQKLLKAQENEASARDELEKFLASYRKEEVPSI